MLHQCTFHPYFAPVSSPYNRCSKLLFSPQVLDSAMISSLFETKFIFCFSKNIEVFRNVHHHLTLSPHPPSSPSCNFTHSFFLLLFLSKAEDSTQSPSFLVSLISSFSLTSSFSPQLYYYTISLKMFFMFQPPQIFPLHFLLSITT